MTIFGMDTQVSTEVPTSEIRLHSGGRLIAKITNVGSTLTALDDGATVHRADGGDPHLGVLVAEAEEVKRWGEWQ